MNRDERIALISVVGIVALVLLAIVAAVTYGSRLTHEESMIQIANCIQKNGEWKVVNGRWECAK